MRRGFALWLALAVLAGALTPLQSRVNGQLAAELGGDGFAAALISFGGGLLLLFLGTFLIPAQRGAIPSVIGALRERRLAWWQVLGGFGGATLVLSQGVTVATIGVALFTVTIVGGQVGGGLAVDRKGLGPAGPQPLTITRMLGAVLVLGAVALSVSDKLHGDFPPWMLAMPFAAGMLISGQQAVNGHVRVQTRSAYSATLMNFLTGTAALAVAFVVHSAVAGLPESLPSNPLLYLGGPIGVNFIAIAAVAVHRLGVLVLGLATIAGQVFGSLVVDLLLPTTGTAVTWATVAGLAVALAGVGVAAVPRRRVRDRAPVRSGP